MNKSKIITEIKGFLEGYNNDLKYVVNVETDPNNNLAQCIIHEPNKPIQIKSVKYTPFMYMKDLGKLGIKLFDGHSQTYVNSIKIKHGITITKLKTGNHERLLNGFCYKIESNKSFNSIITFLRDGGINPYKKVYDNDGNIIKDERGFDYQPNREYFFNVKTTEQFFISTKSRLYKGFEEYKNVHRLTFDIETTGLKYQTCRIFAIGVRDNKGLEVILEVEKADDDLSEIKIIQDFFNLIDYIKPANIAGYFSETFDFDFILGRAKLLNMDLSVLPMGLNPDIPLKRIPNTSVKFGGTSEKYTATQMWGITITDIIFSVKRTASQNSDIKETGLKYISKFENVAKDNRIYIDGEDNSIGRYYNENKLFLIDNLNNYVEILDEFQEISNKLYQLQNQKNNIDENQYKINRNEILKNNTEFVNWFKTNALPKNIINFISGKELVKRYLLDDLYETEQIDELYNQSSFLLGKIIPTNFHRICTMGSAAIWNLILVAWSYENDLAIPDSDEKEPFSGGLARTYLIGYAELLTKIDFAGLYPSIILTEKIIPSFDITGVIQKLLIYFMTTRNIFKKMANTDSLNQQELELLESTDKEVFNKLQNNEISSYDRSLFKIKQLPLKITNNALFGAYGSGVAFNWSDSICAAKITCVARLHIRKTVDWFEKLGCRSLLIVTDGINLQYPKNTNIRLVNDVFVTEIDEKPIEEMWQYKNKIGVDALVEKYNDEIEFHNIKLGKDNYNSIDIEGKFISTLNVARINYALLSLSKDKKTGQLKEKIKLKGNSIKSRTMPEYIEEFIDKALNLILHNKGKEFVDYYYSYAEDIRYMQIPLKKIASKSRIKSSLSAYLKRGKDKNGRDKAMQAHMELILEQRESLAYRLFEEHKNDLIINGDIDPDIDYDKKPLPLNKILKLIGNYMPPEPEIDSMVYYVNTGLKKSHGDSKKILDKKTGKENFCSTLINSDDLYKNPDMKGHYNYEKYLDGFNKKVKTLLVGFEPEIAKRILVKIDKNGELKKEMFTSDQLKLSCFPLDSLEDSMYLENKEVEFWNRTGYDPRLIWDGFKTYEDMPIHYEVYDDALNYLNGLMVKANKPKIRSINDNYKVNDLVLLKNYYQYSIAKYNGTYLEVIKPNVEVPKSDLEIEFEKKKVEVENKLKELESSELTKKSEEELNLERLKIKQEKYFVSFKKRYNLLDNISFDIIINTPELLNKLNTFIEMRENEIEEDAMEYLPIDSE